MKGLSIAAAVLGGAALGALIGILLAPDSGANTRAKVNEYLRSKGIKLPSKKIDELVEQIEEQID
ncbi:MAG: YtxH domain-containing protein [Muribaculaceae bacterium]|nr:YtxH domain-containing protein [Muribaculaceae bacterium]